MPLESSPKRLLGKEPYHEPGTTNFLRKLPDHLRHRPWGPFDSFTTTPDVHPHGHSELFSLKILRLSSAILVFRAVGCVGGFSFSCERPIHQQETSLKVDIPIRVHSKIAGTCSLSFVGVYPGNFCPDLW